MTKKVGKSAEGKFLLNDASNYDKDAYEKPSVTVDICICTVVDDSLKVLMIKRKHNPFKNKWATPGGFMDIPKKESLVKTALRELNEETGVKGIPVHQLATYGDVNRDPRMRIITVAYFACVDNSIIRKQNIKAADDAKEYSWIDLNHIPKLAFDHNKILKDLYERIQNKITYSDTAFQFLPKEFTWNDLQNVYETILNKKLITSNFRRKINSIYNIEVTEKTNKSICGRPAKFLQFNGIKNTF